MPRMPASASRSASGPRTSRSPAPAEPGIEVVPDVIEPLGSDTLVFFSLDGSEVVARLSPRELGAGRPERLRLKPDLERLHLFAASDGRALLGSEPAPAPRALAAAGGR